jgi:hypothetical protein
MVFAHAEDPMVFLAAGRRETIEDLQQAMGDPAVQQEDRLLLGGPPDVTIWAVRGPVTDRWLRTAMRMKPWSGPRGYPSRVGPVTIVATRSRRRSGAARIVVKESEYCPRVS